MQINTVQADRRSRLCHLHAHRALWALSPITLNVPAAQLSDLISASGQPDWFCTMMRFIAVLLSSCCAIFLSRVAMISEPAWRSRQKAVHSQAAPASKPAACSFDIKCISKLEIWSFQGITTSFSSGMKSMLKVHADGPSNLRCAAGCSECTLELLICDSDSPYACDSYPPSHLQSTFKSNSSSRKSLSSSSIRTAPGLSTAEPAIGELRIVSSMASAPPEHKLLALQACTPCFL